MKAKGSMTVFAALTFMLIASFLFALLEAARVDVLRQYTDMTSKLAIESVFAEYQGKLWENYHLLCLDGAYGASTFSKDYIEGVLGARVRRNLEQRERETGLLAAKLISAETVQYQFLTDDEGRVFLKEIAHYMKENLPMEIVQQLYESYTAGQMINDEYQIDRSIEEAAQSIADARAEQSEQSEDLEGRMRRSEGEQKNLLDEVLSWKKNFSLGLVVGDVETLSTKTIDKSAVIERRTMQSGTWEKSADISWSEKLLVTEYAGQYLSNYVDEKKECALSYELEYVIGGMESDRENLQKVVERLLLMREAANVLHIVSDTEKRVITEEMAVSLAGFTANPAIITLVKSGVIAAWAYAESILDVRALLCGDTIAFVKNAEQWTSSLSNISQLLSGNLRAKSCENGWHYGDYMKSFLYLLTDKELAYRMMDVMEQNLCGIYEYKECRMNHMLSAVKFDILYEAEPLFWKFSVLENGNLGTLQYLKEQSFSYY